MLELTDDGLLSASEIRRTLRADIMAKADIPHYPQRANFVSAWYSRMERANRLSNPFKVAYYVSLSLSSLAAASVPALIAAAGSSDAPAANVMRLLAASLGVFVAVTTSVLGVVQVGNRWRVYHAYGRSLEEAGQSYAYGADSSGYPTFVRAVNNAFRTYDREYLNQVAVQQTSAAPGA
jgi:hypothetical protein